MFNYNNQEIYNMNAIASKLSGFLNELHGIRVTYNKEEIINYEKNRIERNIKLLFNYLSYQDKERIKKWQEEYYQELDSYSDYFLDLYFEDYLSYYQKNVCLFFRIFKLFNYNIYNYFCYLICISINC